MKNYFYCIPGSSLVLQNKSQIELQKSSAIRNFMNSLKLSSNTFHCVCLSPDMLSHWILISDILFYICKFIISPHTTILKIMGEYNTWCFNVFCTVIFIFESLHSKYSLKIKSFPCLTCRREERKCSHIWAPAWLSCSLCWQCGKQPRIYEDPSWKKFGRETDKTLRRKAFSPKFLSDELNQPYSLIFLVSSLYIISHKQL